jgi:hypothetical protein
VSAPSDNQQPPSTPPLDYKDFVSRARRKQRTRKLAGAAIFNVVVLAIFLRFTPSAPLRMAEITVALGLWVLYLLSGSPTADVAFEPVQREASTEEARPLTEEERQLQAELRDASGALARCYTRSVWVFGLSLAGIGAGFFMMMWEAAPIAMFILSLFLGGIGLARLQAKGNREAKRVEQLLEHAGPPVAGAVIDFIKSSDAGLQGGAYLALARIAQATRPSDGHFLQPADRKWLYSHLRPDRALADPYFAVSILSMIEQLGDQSAEPTLQDLIGAVYPDTEVSRPVVEAAYFALQSIGQADAKLSARGTLLSPSSVPHPEDADTLLRPGAATPAQPEALLRPSED